MSDRRAGRAALGAAALLLAACGADVVMQTGIPQPGTNDLFTYAQAAAGGAMPTVILGNPFAAPKAEVDAAVLAAMAGSYAGPDVRFTTSPPPQAPPGYEVVVLLNGPPGMAADLLCTDRAAAAALPQPGLTTFVIGFCAEGSLMNGVTGRIPAVSSPHDPAFRRMIARAMADLIPRREVEEMDLRG